MGSKEEMKGVLRACDRKMLRYITGVHYDGRMGCQVWRWLKAKGLEFKLRWGRLRWYGHVKRAREDSAARIVEDMVVAGRRLIGRPKIS